MRQEEIDNAELVSTKTALDGITRFVNNYGHSDELFAKLLMREHRTLQQSVMRLFMVCIEEWSKQEHCDLRNEATIALSRKILSLLEEDRCLPFLPFI